MDTYSKMAFAKLYMIKTPITSADLLNDKVLPFFEEHKAEITRYETVLAKLKKSYSKLPDSKDILDKLDKLQKKKNTLMQEYSSSKSIMDELYKIRKNYGIYISRKNSHHAYSVGHHSRRWNYS